MGTLGESLVASSETELCSVGTTASGGRGGGTTSNAPAGSEKERECFLRGAASGSSVDDVRSGTTNSRGSDDLQRT